jgi:heme-degrading monooxygenase HmoA
MVEVGERAGKLRLWTGLVVLSQAARKTFAWEYPMFIAMNRFKVLRGAEHDFEQVWISRDTHLQGGPGFVEFHLVRGPERDDHTLYASHTIWRSRTDFEAWTRSDAFREAHRNAGENKPMYMGHPEFEGFEVIQQIRR